MRQYLQPMLAVKRSFAVSPITASRVWRSCKEEQEHCQSPTTWPPASYSCAGCLNQSPRGWCEGLTSLCGTFSPQHCAAWQNTRTGRSAAGTPFSHVESRFTLKECGEAGQMFHCFQHHPAWQVWQWVSGDLGDSYPSVTQTSTGCAGVTRMASSDWLSRPWARLCR